MKKVVYDGNTYVMNGYERIGVNFLEKLKRYQIPMVHNQVQTLTMDFGVVVLAQEKYRLG